MKKTLAFITILLVAISLQSFADGADTNSVTLLPKGGLLVHFQKITHGTSTSYSNPFSLDGFIADSSYYYPPSVNYSQDTIDHDNSTAVCWTKIILQGTNVGKAATADWVAVDTLAFYLNDTTTVTAATTFNLNNKKYAYFRWAITGITGNTTAYTKIDMYVYRKDR